MNDIMYKSYFETMHKIEYKDTLFEYSYDWKEVRKEENIEEIIIAKIRRNPGITRKELWLEIVKENFMKWDSSFFHKKIKALADKEPKKIKFVSPTNQLNEESKLYVIQPPQDFLVKEVKTAYKVRILPKVIYKDYSSITGIRKNLVERVNDGSIIVRFNKTPIPKKLDDVVCPHFLELKWAYGCPWDCSWCYLRGTFRFQPNGKAPVIKDYDKIELHTRAFLEVVETPEILNTGEIADSLMFENGDKPFSKFVIPIFESQNKHKVLFLTKSSNVKNLLEIEPHKQAVMSFSLNAIPVADRWEKAPKVTKRIEAAQLLENAGYEVRIRIDPMVPVDDWEKHYYHLVDLIFDKLTPERITLGSLRGLQSTINGCVDKSWVKYLTEYSNWGKKIDFATRLKMYSSVFAYLKKKYRYDKIALCKETKAMWQKLEMDYKTIKCNCIF